MRKLFVIGFKDVRLAFRDRAALILMLAAPFVLTLGLGLVTGRFSGDSEGGISDIPVVIVNLDNDQLGNALTDAFRSEELADLTEPSFSSDADAARLQVDEDEYVAAVIVPIGFTDSIMRGEPAELVPIEVYSNPTRPASAGVIKAIVDEFASRVEHERLVRMTSVMQSVNAGLLAPREAASLAAGSAAQEDAAVSIQIDTTVTGTNRIDFDPLAYIAPGMALLFLMYTVSYGGRSILAERAAGTLPRLLVTPTLSGQILGGKVFGIYLTGAAQMLILIGASSLLFGLRWGDPLGVVALVLAAVFGATGWGLLITALARSPAQVGSLGSAVMLIFGILGGSFINLEDLPSFVQTLSKITPNAWSLDGFTTLGLGGTLSDLGSPMLALFIMGATLFTISAPIFGRRGGAES